MPLLKFVPAASCRAQMNIDVAIVTAAGYPGDASKFEGRLQGLLEAFKRHKLPPSITNRWVGAGRRRLAGSMRL